MTDTALVAEEMRGRIQVLTDSLERLRTDERNAMSHARRSAIEIAHVLELRGQYEAVLNALPT